MVKIKISLKHNSYYIFLQHNIFDNIVMFHKKYYSDCKAIIITDQNVKKYYLERLTDIFSVKNITINFNYSFLVIAKSSMLNNEYKIIKKTIFRDFEKIK